MNFKASLAAGAALLLSAGAQASINSYSGKDDGAAVGGTFTNSNAAAANFAADAGSYGTVKTETFETAPLGYQAVYNLDGVTVTMNASNYGNGFSGVSTTTNGNVYGFDVGTGSGKWLGFPGGSATFAFASATNAFGFYTTGVQTVFGLQFDVTFSDGSAQSFAVPVNSNGGVSFYGLVDSNSFTSVTVRRGGNDAWGIDNVSFTSNAVPEPASWAMMIGGFAIAGAAMRRRASKVAFA